MGDGDRALRHAFRFEPEDLAQNRAGRLSSRQAALLRAGRAGMRLSLAVFAIVMLGSVGLVAFFNRRLGTPGETWDGVGVAAAVAGAVIVLGYVLSRRYLGASRAPRLAVACGSAEIVSDALEDSQIRIGPTVLRLPDMEQFEAFRPGTEYCVYYLEGPVPIVLSAESVGHGVETPDRAHADAEPTSARDQLAVVRRGSVIVVLLGALALGIPVAGVMVADLPPGLRPLAWAGLFAVAIGFVWLAVAWLQPGGRRR